MIRVRFHGRGGQGIKTASRILGSAAFLSGFQAQDSPVYGAERRGAPIAAFTRIGPEPILERGIIERPDLIVIGDETLIDDPLAAPLAGRESASAVFVNTDDARRAAGKIGPGSRIVTRDVSASALERLGRASVLSAGLGAAAARLVGRIEESNLIQAIRSELAGLGVPADLIEKNVEIAREVFAALLPLEIRAPSPMSSPRLVPAAMAAVGFDDPRLASPSITQAGNSVLRLTGNWRLERPEIDLDICSRCDLCYILCPDGAMALNEEGYPVIDYDHCKGCLICRQVCPIRAIEANKEVRAW